MVSKIYGVGADGVTKSLQRIRCKDESSELQELLEKNPHLLPSDQIYPENPPQWLLIKREMPVIDPSTGSERWSIDFLYVDHMAIPTLVECKRCDDTRSRREVIAQMLEYAANGHHYWSAEELQGYAQETAGGLEQLNAWVARNCPNEGGAGEFFETAISNLRKAAIRLIFFLEESPNELRSLVEFLNGQLKETEVLLVEARLFDSPSGRVVVPWLYGYTEQARVAKRESRSQASRNSSARGEEAYLQSFEQSEPNAVTKAGVLSLLDGWSRDKEANPYWTFGVNAILMIPGLLRTRGLLQIGRGGDIQPYFGYWEPEKFKDIGERQVAARNEFASELQRITGVQFSEKQLHAFPTVKAAQWVEKVGEIREAISNIVKKYA